MPTNSLSDLLSSYGACCEARAWAEGRLVDEAAYRACPRGDWLLWILARLGLPRPQLVLAACACARTALRFVPAGEERPLRAIETAEAWARGGEGAPTLADVLAAADAAIAAVYDAAASYAAAAAAAAAYAACDADATAAADAAADAHAYAAYAAYAAYDAAAYAACDAAYATADAAHAAAAAAADAARTEALAESADIVRSIIPWEAVANLATRAP